MALADRLAGPPPAIIKGPRCGVALVLASIDDDADRAALLAVLPRDSGWTYGQIIEACKAEGFQMPRQSLERHRRGECLCAPKD